MSFVVPSMAPKKSEIFKDTIYLMDVDGRKVGWLDERTEVSGLSLYRLVDSPLDEGIVYSIDFLDCEESWMTKVYVKEISVKFIYFLRSVTKKSGKRVFHQKDHREEFSLTKEEVTNLLHKNGQAKEIRVSVQITVEKVSGNRSRRSLPNFNAKADKSSLVVLFDDGIKFYTNIDFLSHFSSHFERLSSNVKEMPKEHQSDLPLLRLDGFKSYAFLGILSFLHGDDIWNEADSWKNSLIDILHLADHLSFERVLVASEKKLIEDDKNLLASPVTKLIWSMEYTLPNLQKSVIHSISSLKDVGRMKKHPDYDALPKEVLQMILEHLVEVEKENGDWGEDSDEDEGEKKEEDEQTTEKTSGDPSD